MIRAATSLAGLATAPLAAQELPFSPSATEACLAGASSVTRQVCVGLSAAACIDTPDGYTTVGMSSCLGMELGYWDARLNAAYGALGDLEKAQDAEIKELGSAAPSMSAALRDMQRAWIAFRDASCAYEASQWGGGTGAGPASVECAMRLTATQALVLEDRFDSKVSQ